MPPSPEPPPRRTVLLTEGSSLSARHTLYALGRQHTVDIVDPSPWCQCRFSRLVRHWYRCPSFSRAPRAYLQFLLERLENERYDVLFPTHEQVYLLAKFREALAPRVGLAVPDFVSLDRVLSKAGFVRLLDELDLPYPPTTITRTREDLQHAAEPPCFLKLAYSTAGLGVISVRDQRQLEQATAQLEQAGLLDGHTEILVQKPARGMQCSVTGIFQHGRLVGTYCLKARAIGEGGMSVARSSAWHPEVVQHLQLFGRHLDWHGALILEYFYDEATGRPQYFEANPRIGETVGAVLSGTNLCQQWLQVALGEEVTPLPMPKTGVRTHSGFMVLLHRARQGATRGQLLAEIGRRLMGEGMYRSSQDELTRPGDDWLSLIPALAVHAQVLARPRAAQRTVESTVDNYALSDRAAQEIRQMPTNLPSQPQSW